MPFGSYQVSPQEAIANAIRFMKAGADCVKLRGAALSETVRGLVHAGIPVMGHIGFTPQTLPQNAWRVQGKDVASARQILDDAQALERRSLHRSRPCRRHSPRSMPRNLSMPTIGIGAGPHCDGQAPIWHDSLGLDEFSPDTTSSTPICS